MQHDNLSARFFKNSIYANEVINYTDEYKCTLQSSGSGCRTKGQQFSSLLLQSACKSVLGQDIEPKFSLSGSSFCVSATPSCSKWEE